MTVIRPNSISGVTSITAQSSTLEYYDSDGNTLTVTGNLTGDVNSPGISTFSQLNVGAGGTIITTTAGGNVGVGTENPQVKFHVSSGETILRSAADAQVSLRIQRSSSSGRSQFTLEDETGSQIWRVGSTGSGSSDFSFYNGNNRLVIDSSGRVTMPYQPACDAYGSGTCTVSDGTSQDIPITTFFSNRGFSIVSNKLVIPKSGYYHLTTSYISQITGSGYSIRAIHIFPLINGVDIVSSYYDSRWNSVPTAGFSNTHYEISHSWILSLTENDQIDLRVVIYHNKGTTLNDPYRASIFAHLLG